MNNAATSARFVSFRTLWGFVAGIIIALIYTLLFNQPGQFTPIISLIVASLTSKLSAPKHLAGLGALIGIPVSIAAGLQSMQSGLGAAEDGAALAGMLIAIYFYFSFVMIIWTAYFAFLGFLFAQLIKLYKRGSIF